MSNSFLRVLPKGIWSQRKNMFIALCRLWKNWLAIVKCCFQANNLFSIRYNQAFLKLKGKIRLKQILAIFARIKIFAWKINSEVCQLSIFLSGQWAMKTKSSPLVLPLIKTSFIHYFKFNQFVNSQLNSNFLFSLSWNFQKLFPLMFTNA